jgi:hypothetical protein
VQLCISSLSDRDRLWLNIPTQTFCGTGGKTCDKNTLKNGTTEVGFCSLCFVWPETVAHTLHFSVSKNQVSTQRKEISWHYCDERKIRLHLCSSKHRTSISVKNVLITPHIQTSPLTCWTEVSFFSQRSSKLWGATGSKSAVYCLIPPVAV